MISNKSKILSISLISILSIVTAFFAFSGIAGADAVDSNTEVTKGYYSGITPGDEALVFYNESTDNQFTKDYKVFNSDNSDNYESIISKASSYDIEVDPDRDENLEVQVDSSADGYIGIRAKNSVIENLFAESDDNQDGRDGQDGQDDDSGLGGTSSGSSAGNYYSTAAGDAGLGYRISGTNPSDIFRIRYKNCIKTNNQVYDLVLGVTDMSFVTSTDSGLSGLNFNLKFAKTKPEIKQSSDLGTAAFSGYMKICKSNSNISENPSGFILSAKGFDTNLHSVFENASTSANNDNTYKKGNIACHTNGGEYSTYAFTGMDNNTDNNDVYLKWSSLVGNDPKGVTFHSVSVGPHDMVFGFEAPNHKVSYVIDPAISGSDVPTITSGTEEASIIHGDTITTQHMPRISLPNQNKYKFSGYVCDKKVSLSDGDEIPAGRKLTGNQLAEVVVEDNLKFTLQFDTYVSLNAVTSDGGSISGIDNTTKEPGSNYTWWVKPGDSPVIHYAASDGYRVKSIEVDGVALTNPNQLNEKLKNMDTNKSVNIDFEKIPNIVFTKEIVEPQNHKVNSYGDVISYKLKVQQTVEGAAVNDFNFTDIIPEGLALVEGSLKMDDEPVEMGSAADPNKIAFKIPSMTNPVGHDITYDCITTKDSLKTDEFERNLTNTAKITEDTTSPFYNPVSVTADASVTVVQPKLEISKTADKTEGFRGDNITYKATISNTGGIGSELRHVVFSDIIPKGLVFDSAKVMVGDKEQEVSLTQDSAGTKFNVVLDEPIISTGNPETSSITLTYTCRVEAPYGVFTNESSAVGYIQYNSADSNTPAVGSGASSKHTLTVTGPKLALEKSVSKDYTYYDDVYTYTIKVKNTQAGTYVTDLTVSDVLGPGVVLDTKSVKVSGGTGFSITDFHQSSGAGDNTTIKILIPRFDEELTITYNVRVSDVAGNVKNSVSVNTADCKEFPAPASTSIDIKKPVFTFAKEVSQRVANPDMNITYTVRINESENVTASNVVVTDVLPTGFDIDQNKIKVDSKSKSSYKVDNGSLIITFDKFDESAIINYTGKVTAPDGGTLVNKAQMTSTNTGDASYSDSTETFVTVDNISIKDSFESDKSDDMNDDEDITEDGEDSDNGSDDVVEGSDDNNDEEASSDGTNTNDDPTSSNGEEATSDRSNMQTGDYGFKGALIFFIISIVAIGGLRIRSFVKKSKQ